MVWLQKRKFCVQTKIKTNEATFYCLLFYKHLKSRTIALQSYQIILLVLVGNYYTFHPYLQVKVLSLKNILGRIMKLLENNDFFVGRCRDLRVVGAKLEL